jgi:hypothetical protein
MRHLRHAPDITTAKKLRLLEADQGLAALSTTSKG